MHIWEPRHFVIIAIFVLSGSMNTLVIKGIAKINVTAYDGNYYMFNHPFIITFLMFVGETLGMVYFFILVLIIRCCRKERLKDSKEASTLLQRLSAGHIRFNPLILLAPTLCDLIASAMMFVGITMTNAASFQMMRGFVIVCVALMSRIFLKRHFPTFSWIGIFITMLGLFVVGLADYITPSVKERGSVLAVLGNCLILLAQVAAASQAVLQESYLEPVDIPPLFAVGIEGIFGCIVQGILLVPLHYVRWQHSDNPGNRLEDVKAAISQAGKDGVLLTLLLIFPVVISVYNVSGVTMTKQLSSTTRKVSDSFRTVIIWVTALILQWDTFRVLQPIGFLIMLTGMFLYYDIFVRKGVIWCLRKLHIIRADEEGKEKQEENEEDNADNEETITNVEGIEEG